MAARSRKSRSLISSCRRGGVVQEFLDHTTPAFGYPLPAGAVAEPQISPRTPPACVFHYSATPGGSLRFAHRGLNSFTPPACKPAARKGCSDISPGLSEAIPGVIAPPLDSRTLKACEEIPVEQQAQQEEGSSFRPACERTPATTEARSGGMERNK